MKLRAVVDTYRLYVAPHAGAWIETKPHILALLMAVAPHAGAWIET